MSFLDKIKMGKDEIFIPGCKVDAEASSDGTLVINCNPKLQVGNKVLTGSSTTKLIVDGDKAKIIDDGGVPIRVLEALRKYLDQNVVR